MTELHPLDDNPVGPLVSVIVPTFNSERFLLQALDSAIAQDYRPIEIVAVDDGSTDGTWELLRRRAGVKRIRQVHAGVSSARNMGISAATGSILAFLDSDDLWPSNRLKIAIGEFETHPEIGYILGKEIMFAEPDYRIPAWIKPDWLSTPQDASNAGVLMARRETFACVGMFNVHLESGEDTEWLVRAGETNIPMARLPEVLLCRRLHDANLSTATIASRGATLARIAREAVRRRRAAKNG
jgi:glycosyltransferase involved in cell wall biosynthesis